MKVKKPRHSLLYGTALLFASNVLVKGLGFFYRVILVRLLGAEGIGLVEMVTPIYSCLLVLAGLGLQPALAQSVAAKGAELAETDFRTARRMLLLSGASVTAVAIILAPLLSVRFAADARVEISLVAILPAVLIVSLASSWRGWFQGRRELGALGMSQNAEQIARVALGIYLVRRLRPLGIELAAAGVSLATVGGELIGYLYLALLGRFRRRKVIKKRLAVSWQTARRLLDYGLPMTGGRSVNSVLLMLQAYLIPFCLQKAGYGVAAATEIYGRFSGVALTLLHLPGVFASALATAVMPAVAGSIARPDALRDYIVRPLQATLICTLPGMALLFIYAGPLCSRLFDNAPAASILRLLAPGGVFFYMQMTLAGVLQGLGDVRRLLVNNALAGCVLLLGVWQLVPVNGLGIGGAALSADLSYLCGFLLHLAAVRRHLRQGLPWGRIAVPPLLALAAAGAVWLVCEKTAAASGVVISIAGAAVAYLSTLYLCRQWLQGEGVSL